MSVDISNFRKERKYLKYDRKIKNRKKLYDKLKKLGR